MPFNVSQDEQASQAFFEQKTFVVPRRAGTSSSGDSNATRVPRARSVDSRKSKENDDGMQSQRSRKRKAGRMDESTRTPAVSAPYIQARRPIPRAEFPKRRRHKVPRPTITAATRPAEHREVLSATTARSQASSDGMVSSTDEELPRRPDWLRAQTFRRGRLRYRRASFNEVRTFSHEDIEILKGEVADLQKQVEVAEKTIADQTQAIEVLKRELAASKKINRKQGSQIEKLKTSGKKSDDILNTTQTLLQCQICMELLLKPFALSPCGHVLCQGCLQDWFRNAPRQPGEGDDEGEPLATIYRSKICPCCRTEVIRRPTPLFIIKDLVAPFIPEVQSPPPIISAEASATAEGEDPWAGIFRDDDDSSGTEYDEDDPYDSDEESDVSSVDLRFLPRAQFFSSDEEDNEELTNGDEEDEELPNINYVVPAWAPPYHRATVSRRNLPAPMISQERFQLLQRGATRQMIERFDMRLDRNEGIVAWTDGGVEVYLGWNIARPTGDDLDGERFMEWVEFDIGENPQRWRLDVSADHALYRRVIEDYRGTEVLGLEEDSEDEFD